MNKIKKGLIFWLIVVTVGIIIMPVPEQNKLLFFISLVISLVGMGQIGILAQAQQKYIKEDEKKC